MEPTLLGVRHAAPEGVVKYRVVHQADAGWVRVNLQDVEAWRQRLQQQGWLGQSADGWSYGNVSQRHPQRGFVITATQVAHRATLTPADYVHVTDYDPTTHTLTVVGSTCASSEAPTHWAVYQLDPRIQVVFHIHCPTLWAQLQQQPEITCTPPDIPYGTQAMVAAIQHLYPADPLSRNCFVMAGHQDGIVSFGRTAAEAGQVLFAHARLKL
jgi:ribulose-5-phosphate 4-epimerase/fuculose-1-phosphate aldolase